MEINILQELIYALNEDRERDVIMRHLCRTTSHTSHVVWKGTFRLDARRRSFQPWRLRARRCYLFTVAYRYGQNRIHFVAFVLDTMNDDGRVRLVCFDPGYNLYVQGTKVIVPIVRNAFEKGLGKRHLNVVYRTACIPIPRTSKVAFGVQFNGGASGRGRIDMADAFCQSWTLFFLKTYVENDQTDDFFKKWCAIPPRDRWVFLTHSFLIPSVVQHRVLRTTFCRHLPTLQSYLLSSFWTSRRTAS